jgi:hypothetical protein
VLLVFLTNELFLAKPQQQTGQPYIELGIGVAAKRAAVGEECRDKGRKRRSGCLRG